ncbi:hypothetical protein C9439_07255 [archaeon SCG-AAA382B04]|nr:hypothetical protein C9439_07255 [archaeon SCG-AAA382B04]
MTCEKDIQCGVNTPHTEKVEDMSDLEKKHAVLIECPDKVKKGELFEVEIRVGEYLVHPNKLSHFIEWMELYQEETFISRISLTPEKSHYIFKTSLKLEHEHPLKARVRCNLHGVWEAKKEIEVI